MEEISLRELLEIIIRRKYIIVYFVLLFVASSFILNFFILEPKFEARMVLMASNFSERLQAPQHQGEGIDGILSSFSKYPSMTMETYKQQVKAPRILRETIEDLNLHDKYDIELLSKQITLETIKDTNLIIIKIQNSDAQLAADIVNKVGEKFTKFVSDKVREQATTSSIYLSHLLETEKENLDSSLFELKNFIAQPRGTAELTKELEAKLNLITEFKSNLINSNLSKEVLKKKINATKTQLSMTPQTLITKKSVIDDNVIYETIKDQTNQSSKEILNIVMRSEEINPVYLELSKLQVNLNIEIEEVEATLFNLENQINITQQQIDQLQIELAEKSHIETQLMNKVDLARNYHNSFNKKYEELRIAESSQISESNMVIISRAFPSTKAIAPRKFFNISVATISGLLVGIFVLIFVEYWQTSELTIKNEQ